MTTDRYISGLQKGYVVSGPRKLVGLHRATNAGEIISAEMSFFDPPNRGCRTLRGAINRDPMPVGNKTAGGLSG